MRDKKLYMPNKHNFSTFTLLQSDTLRFRSIVIDIMSRAASLDAQGIDGGIGTLSEKQMHAAIKRFICPDTSCHEVKLDVCDSYDENGEKMKKRRFVADILKDGTVYEIQTGRLAPLHEKISWILENTTYNIMVVHPIAKSKWVNVLNSKNDIEKRYRSPIKGKITDIAPEIYAFKDFIGSPRFALVILMIEAEQYMKNTAKNNRSRPRYKKYELIPVNLLSATVFSSIDDYKRFIPESLDEVFTVKQFSRETKIRGMDAYSAVHSLCDIKLLTTCGKIGKATAYRRTF